MAWLIDTAWKCGMNHVEEQRYAQGLPFMAAALSLMDFSHLFEDAKEVTINIFFTNPVDISVLRRAKLCGLHCDQAAGKMELQELV